MKRKNKRKNPYTRRCKKCEKLFKTWAKTSKVCEKCSSIGRGRPLKAEKRGRLRYFCEKCDCYHNYYHSGIGKTHIKHRRYYDL